jgi:hypothetical protein
LRGAKNSILGRFGEIGKKGNSLPEPFLRDGSLIWGVKKQVFERCVVAKRGGT